MARIAGAGADQRLITGSGSAFQGPCLGQVWSFDADGKPLDMAFDWSRELPPLRYSADQPNPLVQAFTADNPFIVDLDGALIYTGVSGGFGDGTGPYDTDWFINVDLVGFASMNVDSGGRPNEYYQSQVLGAVSLGESVPAMAKISGLVAADGQIAAPGTGNGTFGDQNSEPFLCVASGFIKVTGGMPATAIGFALVLISTAALFLYGRPERRVRSGSLMEATTRRPIRGFLYGSVLGLGLALIAIGRGWAALGTRPPVLIFFAGIVVGSIWSICGPTKKPNRLPPEFASPPGQSSSLSNGAGAAVEPPGAIR